MALFDVRELIAVAIKDEETGIAFYRALAQATRNPKVKERCREIAKQEEHHAERFQGMLDGLGDYRPKGDYSGEYEDYLKALLDSRAFPEPAKAAAKAKAVKSDAEAIDIAMRLEKDTLIFLEEMKGYTRDADIKEVDEVIKEERLHLKDLAQLKASLK
ncbi:MAG: ferritin family protein [Planctomycetota bacterium]